MSNSTSNWSLTDSLQNVFQYNNIYLGKNVQFADSIAYVTKLGYVKKYNGNLSEKNGCSTYIFNDSEAKKVKINGFSFGADIVINDLKLKMGTDMKETDYCGNEGSNILVNQYDNNENSYVGCYKQDESLIIDDTNLNPYYNYESCKQLARGKGNQYFGIANSDVSGYGNCVLSKTLSEKTTKYDNNMLFTENWYRITDNDINKNVNNIRVNQDGNIELFDYGSNIIGIIGTLANNPKCGVNNGSINNLTATFGINCLKTDNSNIDAVFDGNVTNIVHDFINDKSSKKHNIVINRKNNFKDVAYGCQKKFSMSYACGDDSNIYKVNIPKEAWGKTAVVNCTKEFYKCNNYLKINNDGTVTINSLSDKILITIFKCPIDPSICLANKNIYDGKPKDPNNKDINKLKNGQTMSLDDALMSKNKKYKLSIKNGVLSFCCYTNSVMCSNKNNNYAGNAGSVSLYKFNTPPNIDNMNKMAYIDGNSHLHTYPDNMSSLINTYKTFDNSDMASKNISETKETNIGMCQQKCDSNNGCHGFRFKTSASSIENNCFLKGSHSIIMPTNPNETNTLYVRNKSINNSDFCNKDIYNVTPSEYNAYTPSSTSMSFDKKCIDATGASSIEEGFEMLSDELTLIQTNNKNIRDGLNKINYPEITSQLATNESNNVIYGKNNTKYTNFIDLNGNYNGSIDYRENMENINQNMNTINEMLNDANLINVQQKYQNIFWSILAIGTFVFTISNLKK